MMPRTFADYDPTKPPRPRSYKVGDVVRYRHGTDKITIEGSGRILAFGESGCLIESPDGRRSTVLHSAIVPPGDP